MWFKAIVASEQLCIYCTCDLRFSEQDLGFKNTLRSAYGRDVIPVINGYQRCVKKHARFRNHVIKEDHAMHWKPRLVGKEKNTTKRKVKEALLIKKLKNGKGVINQDNGLMLSPLCLDLVK